MVKRPWLAHYDQGVPASLEPYPDLTLVDYLWANARDEPEHPVVLFKGATVTASRLERLSNAFAAALLDLGVSPGDRVALLLPNCPQFLIAQFGAWKAGAIVAPLDPASPAGVLETLLAQLEPRVLITITSSYARAKAAKQQLRIPHLLVTGIKEHLPHASRFLFDLLQDVREGHRLRLSPDDQWLPELLESYRGAHRPRLTISPDADATLLSTGGAAGDPKLVLGTHRAGVASGFQLSAWLRDFADTDTSVMMLSLPLHHTTAMLPLQGLALMARLPLALVPEPGDVRELLKTLQRVRPAFLSGSPSTFSSILDSPLVRSGSIDFSSLKICLTSGGPMQATARERCEKVIGCAILDGYGLTESQSVITVNPAGGTRRSGSVGLPLPDTSVRICDFALPHEELSPGTIGEIWVSCPQQMRGYWRKSGDVPPVFIEEDGKQWLRTGDAGYLDVHGHLYLVGRVADMIRIDGVTVWPSEVEDALVLHPSVADAGVAGVPDDRRGQVARAWIVPAPGAVPTEDELRNHCADRLVSYKVPTLISFCDALPRTSIGALLRRKLVESHESQARTAAALAGLRLDQPVRLPTHDERVLGRAPSEREREMGIGKRETGMRRDARSGGWG